MKKTAAVLLVLILGISMLAGCGGGDTQAPPATAPTTSTTTPATTPTPTTPTPTPTPMETYDLPSESYGGMSISYPEGTNIEVIEDENENFSDFIQNLENVPATDMGKQYAHVIFDDFALVMGYKDYGKSYEAAYEAANGKNFRDIEFGNAKGFAFESYGLVYLCFPSVDDEHVRCIAVYTDDSLASGDPTTLLDQPEITAVLDTLVLTGDVPVSGTTAATDDPASPASETVEGGYITFTAEDGWYVDSSTGSEGAMSYTIKYQDSLLDRIEIRLEKFSVLAEHVEWVEGSTMTGEFLDDMTIGGVTYKVYKMSDDMFNLYTSTGAFDEQKMGMVVIALGCDLETATPFLEAVSLHEID